MHFCRIIVCFLVVLFTLCTAWGQKTYNVWAFGYKSGLNFNTSPASFAKSKSFIDHAPPNSPPSFYTSVCDKEGNLKFYTNGMDVWNRDHFLMPKYRAWWPWSGRLVPLLSPYPDPANDSLYYLFGISNGRNANKLQYITIKMHNAGDLEEVIYPRPTDQVSYYNSVVEDASLLLAGTVHCNQKDTWIVTHTPGALNSVLVSKDGVSTTPVRSPVPADVLPLQKIDAQLSNLKFAANGERLAFPLIYERKIVVFDFDNQSGKFFNPVQISLPDNYTLEDIELSPDAGKLYVGAWYHEMIDGQAGAEIHKILQYDLNAGNATQIAQSVYPTNGFGDRVSCFRTCYMMKRTLQLGPDGKIYASMRYTGGEPIADLKISMIDAPNKLRDDVNYRRNFIKTDSIYQIINYNYIRSGSFSLQENGIQIQKKTCSDQPVNFGLLFNRVDSVKWDFGDPSSGEANYSTLLNPQHKYPAPGTYFAKAILYIRCFTDTAFKEVIIQPDKSVKVPDYIRDTIACIGEKLTLDAKVANATAYSWDNGLIYSNRTFDTSGRYTISVYNDCSMDKKAFTVRYKECPCQVHTPNAFTPNNDGINDNFKPVVECLAKDYQFRIYNRYGGIAFESSESNKGWNGKVGNSLSPSGVYLWSLQYRNPSTKELFVKHGTVVLIR